MVEQWYLIVLICIFWLLMRLSNKHFLKKFLLSISQKLLIFSLKYSLELASVTVHTTLSWLCFYTPGHPPSGSIWLLLLHLALNIDASQGLVLVTSFPLSQTDLSICILSPDNPIQAHSGFEYHLYTSNSQILSLSSCSIPIYSTSLPRCLKSMLNSPFENWTQEPIPPT